MRYRTKKWLLKMMTAKGKMTKVYSKYKMKD